MWVCLTQWLEHLGQEFRKKLSNLKVDTSRSSGKCGIEDRGRDIGKRGRGECIWGCDGECICVKELSICGTLQAQSTQWVARGSAFEEVMDGSEVKNDGFVCDLQVTPLYRPPCFLSTAKNKSLVPAGDSASLQIIPSS